jgi:hypothetical protein
MLKKGQTKRQHYVPQMILRNFSTDSATISLCVLSNWKCVDGAPINRQCYESYFYGADQATEQSFSNEESKISGYLGDLSVEHLASFTVDQLEALKFFVHYQKARTRGAAEALSKRYSAFVSALLKSTNNLKNGAFGNDEDVAKVQFILKNAQHETLWQAVKSTPLLFDLTLKFVVTTRSQGFIIGDHPVVAYNQFAEHHPRFSHYPSTSGLAVKGLQLFMPVSPNVVLAIYDHNTYEYGGKSLICRAGPSDVAYLNRMQAVNALECIFFDKSRVDDVSLNDLLRTRKVHTSIYDKDVRKSPFMRKEHGKISQAMAIIDKDIRVGAKLSFIRILDRRLYENHKGVSIPFRSPQLMRLTELYGEYLENKVKCGQKPTDFNDTTSMVEPKGK